jgi:hypothetical protein
MQIARAGAEMSIGSRLASHSLKVSSQGRPKRTAARYALNDYAKSASFRVLSRPFASFRALSRPFAPFRVLSRPFASFRVLSRHALTKPPTSLIFPSTTETGGRP